MPKGTFSNPFHRNIAFWLVISLMMVLLFNLFNRPQVKPETISFSQFINAVERGEVASVTIQGNKVSGTYLDGRKFKLFVPEYPDLVKTAYRRFCEGMKVAPEIAMIAVDIGLIPEEDEVISIRKWDTAIVLKPTKFEDFSELKITEVLCMPR